MTESRFSLLSPPVPDAAHEDDLLEEKTFAHRTLVDRRFMKCCEEEVLLPDGRTSRRFFVTHSGAAGMVVLYPDKTLVLERQWRHPMRRSYWEIPAGKLDQGESPEACAKRELLEECGIEARRWTKLGIVHTAIGYSNEQIHLFLAEDLTEGCQQLDEGEHLEVYRIPVAEAVQMAADGRIRDSKTIAALFWLEKHLQSR